MEKVIFKQAFRPNAGNPQPKSLSSNSCFFMQEPRCKVLTMGRCWNHLFFDLIPDLFKKRLLAGIKYDGMVILNPP